MLLGSMPLASLTCAVRGDRTPVFASELGISGAVIRPETNIAVT